MTHHEKLKLLDGALWWVGLFPLVEYRPNDHGVLYVEESTGAREHILVLKDETLFVYNFLGSGLGYFEWGKKDLVESKYVVLDGGASELKQLKLLKQIGLAWAEYCKPQSLKFILGEK